MPRSRMIGEKQRASKLAPKSLSLPKRMPSEARALARLLNQLETAPAASDALVGAVSQVRPLSSERDKVCSSLKGTLPTLMKQQTTNSTLQQVTSGMAMAAELAIRAAFHDEPPRPPKRDTRASKKRHGGRSSISTYESDDVDSVLATVPMTRKTKTAAALVSDSSTVGSEVEARVLEPVETEARINKFWGCLLESCNLQVTSRTTNTWGRKKVYEIYHLSSSISRLGALDNICSRVEKEFRTVFHGDAKDESGCRTYAVLSSKTLYIQLNVGRLLDLDDEQRTVNSSGGAKKQKRDREFVAIVNGGSPMIALTASRKPSSTRLTKFVLAALDAALTHTGSTPCEARDMIPRRVGDWSGAEPLELLKSARAAESKRAVGRFANYAAEKVDNPLSELHGTSTSSLLDRSVERNRLEIGAQHGRSVAHMAKSVQAPAQLVATKSGGLLLDHSAEAKQGRKRARDDQFGRKGDNPKLQRLCWKWAGETSAASACWLAEGESADELPKTKFKCGVVIQGTDVIEGLRSMTEAGFAEAPLPDFVRDATTMGSTTITVENGSVTGNDQFAQV